VVLFLETGISQWIPASIAGAGLLLLVDLLVIRVANPAPTEDEAHHHDGGGSQTVHKEEKHYHD
jgi:hypothetical protein